MELMEMLIKTTRFGDIQVDEKDIINFSSGLLAFEDSNKFILLDITENINFKWLQSADNPDLVFLLTDPFFVKPDYYVDLNNELIEELNISASEDVLVYTIVNVPKSGLKEATTNLIGPLIINWRKKMGKQIVFERDSLSIKYPLFVSECKKLSYGG
jgi:flagellar assembly factor FliW